MTGRPHGDFMLWFDLRTAAEVPDWAKVNRLLAAATGRPVPRHTLTTQVMVAAAAQGRQDVVTALLARGYVPVKQDINEIFVFMTDAPGVAACFAQVLAQVPDADVATCVRIALTNKDVDRLLPVLRDAGVDVSLGGFALEYVIAKQAPEGLAALLAHKVFSPFTPAVARAAQAMDGSEDLRDVYARAVAESKEADAMIARFRAKLAADEPVRAALFLNPHAHDAAGGAVTLLGVMAARGLLGEVFAAKVWRHHPEDVVTVHAALVEYGLQDKVSLAAVAAELRRQAIGRRAGFRIGPR